MVASRITVLDELDLPKNTIDKEIVNDPEKLHGIKLTPVKYRVNINMESIDEKMRKLLDLDDVNETENKRRYQSLVTIGFKLYCRHHEKLMKRMKREEQHHCTMLNVMLQKNTSQNYFMKISANWMQ